MVPLLLIFVLYLANQLSSGFRPSSQVLSSGSVDFSLFSDLVDGASSFLLTVFIGLFVLAGFVIGIAKEKDIKLTFALLFSAIFFAVFQILFAGMYFGVRTEMINEIRVDGAGRDHIGEMLRLAAVFVFFSFCSLSIGVCDLIRQLAGEK